MSVKLVVVIVAVLAAIHITGTVVGFACSDEADEDNPPTWIRRLESGLVRVVPLSLRDVTTTCRRCGGHYCVNEGRRCRIDIAAREGPMRAAVLAARGRSELTVVYKARLETERPLDPRDEDKESYEFRFGEEGASVALVCPFDADCRVSLTPSEEREQ